jgi:hypothetical protein
VSEAPEDDMVSFRKAPYRIYYHDEMKFKITFYICTGLAGEIPMDSQMLHKMLQKPDYNLSLTYTLAWGSKDGFYWNQILWERKSYAQFILAFVPWVNVTYSSD